MVLDSLKTYLDHRATHKQEKAIAKAAKKERELEEYANKWAAEEYRRWGMAREDDYDEEARTTRAVVRRYQRTLGIDHLMDPRTNRGYYYFLNIGYFEPIPAKWLGSYNNPLTGPANSAGFDDAAEERLYWVLNNRINRDLFGNIKPGGPMMKPDEYSETRMANARMRTALPIDPKWGSDGDFFKTNQKYAKRGYSKQVPPLQISSAFRELFQTQARARELGGQGHLTDEVDVMCLLDVSSSMGWDHPAGFHQPRHVDVVHNIFRRAIHHMEVRDPYPSNGVSGVETICFNSYGYPIGKVNWANFEGKWQQISNFVYAGGGTQVMTGWQAVKESHFRKHGSDGKAWKDPIFGWQPTKQMAKLSLLVMLDGEARDMDEFELELLSEKWAYVTICLIGKENCPDHHRHANELTRIANANDHIQFFDVHGRICERLVVSDVLQRVYASAAPTYDEIMNPAYDLPGYHLK